MFISERQHNLYVFIFFVCNQFKFHTLLSQERILAMLKNLSTFLEFMPKEVLNDTSSYITGSYIHPENGQIYFTATTSSYQILQDKLQQLSESLQDYNVAHFSNADIQLQCADILQFMLPS